MSLLFIYIVFGPILHILVIHCQDDVCLEQSCCYKSFVIVSTQCRRYVASGTGFKQITESKSGIINKMQFFTEFRFEFTCI